MNLFFKIKKIFRYLLILDFKPIKKNKILLFSSLKNSEINKLYKINFTRMYLPSEKLNFFILLKMIILLKYKKIDYFYFIMKAVKPKIFISNYDNDLDLYYLKNIFPNIKFILIQNGRRDELKGLFNNKLSQTINNKIFIDFFFVFGEALKKKYQEHINANFFCTGSLKNNFHKISNKKNSKRKIVLISQFRPKFNLSYRYKNKSINYDQYYNNSKILFINLENYCEKNKIELIVLPSSIFNSKAFKEEKLFYNNISKSKKIKFIYKIKNEDTYKILNKFDFFFGEESTLLYEALARNKKIGAFLRLKNIESYNFLWPLSKKKKGFFYSEEPSYTEIKRVHKNLMKINTIQWTKYIKDLKKNLMCFDYGNKTLKNIIKKEISSN